MQHSRRQVRDLFSKIAPRYDLLNHVLSAGFDFSWRKRLVRSCNVRPEARILDVATGTGDLLAASRHLRPALLVGLDIARPMLSLASQKSGTKGALFVEGAAEGLPFRDGAFDLVMVAFGVRNFSERAQGLRELHRVLSHDGSLRILEFCRPHPVLTAVFRPYFRFILPKVGGLISGHRDAYEYLPDTVSRFPSAGEFGEELKQAGFSAVRWTHLTGGIVTLFEAS